MTPVRRHDGDSSGQASAAYEHNQAFWDEVTPVHVTSDYYQLDKFKRGDDILHKFIVDEVGDVSGLSMLHLQCHFGLDTLNWARKGVIPTGVDISGASIERARELSVELGITASFVQANVLEMGDRFDSQFDRVFTSIGSLCWIGDMAAWGKAVARALKPGGQFYIAEFHPVLDTLQQSRPITESSAAYPTYPYFGNGVALRFDPEGDDSDYAEASFTSEETTFEWFHPMSEIIEALIAAGLAIQRFREHPFVTYKARQGMVQGDDGLWRLPPDVVPLPLMFTLTASKSASGPNA
jgi:ubiquinone/menaquinone biosynthesis C-methylase UbiE